jgi:hypothetical protein
LPPLLVPTDEVAVVVVVVLVDDVGVLENEVVLLVLGEVVPVVVVVELVVVLRVVVDVPVLVDNVVEVAVDTVVEAEVLVSSTSFIAIVASSFAFGLIQKEQLKEPSSPAIVFFVDGSFNSTVASLVGKEMVFLTVPSSSFHFGNSTIPTVLTCAGLFSNLVTVVTSFLGTILAIISYFVTGTPPLSSGPFQRNSTPPPDGSDGIGADLIGDAGVGRGVVNVIFFDPA